MAVHPQVMAKMKELENRIDILEAEFAKVSREMRKKASSGGTQRGQRMGDMRSSTPEE